MIYRHFRFGTREISVSHSDCSVVCRSIGREAPPPSPTVSRGVLDLGSLIQYFSTFFRRDSSTQNESGYVGVGGVFFGATDEPLPPPPPTTFTGGDVRGVVWRDNDNGTVAVPAAAPDGVLISAECLLSVTDRYRCGLVL